MRGKVTSPQKREAIKRVLLGATTNSVAKENGIPESTLRSWVKKERKKMVVVDVPIVAEQKHVDEQKHVTIEQLHTVVKSHITKVIRQTIALMSARNQMVATPELVIEALEMLGEDTMYYEI